MRIKILDPLVANQIAAGEVIERPSSIVKECLENSLDAGATQLIIEIEQGGIRLIRITDNGHGIAKDDLPLAVMRHGTSKISDSSDLAHIASLGFRGEALASICAVAHVTLASNSGSDDHGWQLKAVATDAHVEEQPVAHPVGTSISIRDLFFNMPARRRFLRTEKTEFSHIEEVVKRIALSRFNLAIKLVHNQRLIYQLPAADRAILQDRRINQLCGKAFMEAALKIDFQATGLRLWGWLAEPAFVRSQADMQYLYINGRMVKDRLLNHAIRQSYQHHINHDQYPAYILFLECDPGSVDVNVHPTKHEVRFHESRLIHDFVVASLKKVFNSDSLPEQETVHANGENQSLKPHYGVQGINPAKVAEQQQVYSQWVKPDVESESILSILGEPLTVMADRFLITKLQSSIGLIDLNQTHGLLFKKAWAKSIMARPLLFPVSLALPDKNSEQMQEYLPALNSLGFQLEILGPKQLVLRQVPSFLERINHGKFIENLVQQLKPQLTQDALINLIAESAADSIRPLETKVLQEKLLQTMQQQLTAAELKHCCRTLGMGDLEKLFHHG